MSEGEQNPIVMENQVKAADLPAVSRVRGDCPICTLSYTALKRQSMTCNYCQFEYCKQCCKQYLLTKSQPQCMKCNAVWNEEFLEQMFPVSWVDGELRQHLNTVIFEQEKSMLSVASQEIYRREIQRRRELLQQRFNNATNTLEECRRRVTLHQNALQTAQQRLPHCAYEHQRAIVERDISIREKAVRDSEMSVRTQEQILEMIIKEIEVFNEQNDEKVSISAISIRCPKSMCKGFLTPKYYCPVCSENFCPDCHVSFGKQTSDAKHKCDSELVKTIRLLSKETKPCPNCKIAIFKLEGCNMMFCTNCNTGFNWLTGEIEKGRIHNPHYFEWMRTRDQRRGEGQAPQVNGDGAGHGECRIGASELRQILTTRQVEKTKYERAMLALNLLIHIEEEMLGHRRLPEYPNRHLDLRIRFVSSKGSMKEEEWKKLLSMDERNYRLQFKARQLIETLRLVLLDIFRRIQAEESYTTMIEDINAVVDYYNEHSRRLYKRYNRRFYNGIEKQRLVETDLPIVEDEAPYDYEVILQTYQKTPEVRLQEVQDTRVLIERIEFLEAPSWLDEEEKKYFSLFQAFQKIRLEQSLKVTSPSFQERVMAFCGTPERNELLHQYDSIVGARIRSTQKKRVNILKNLGHMIYHEVQNFIDAAIRVDIDRTMTITSIGVDTVRGRYTCGWLVPIWSELSFPVHICGFYLNMDLCQAYNLERRALAFRSVEGDHDDQSNVLCTTVSRDQYQSFPSMTSWICHNFVTHFDKYRQHMTPAQLWKSLFDRMRYWVPMLRYMRCIETREIKERFISLLSRLYANLEEDPRYTRKKMLVTENRQIRYIIQ